jgi:hypothetical protein
MHRAPDSIEEMTENPELFGMPTFEDFRRNKEKYLGRKDDAVSAVDAGDRTLKCRQKYFMKDANGIRYSVCSLEEAERIALDMGGNLHQDFAIKPQLRPDDAGGFYNEVTFVSKAFLTKRANW